MWWQTLAYIPIYKFNNLNGLSCSNNDMIIFSPAKKWALILSRTLSSTHRGTLNQLVTQFSFEIVCDQLPLSLILFAAASEALSVAKCSSLKTCNPGQKSLVHLTKWQLVMYYFEVGSHYLICWTPLPPKTMLK